MSAYPSSPTTSTGGWRRGEDTTTTSAEETTTAPEHEPEPTKPKTTKPEPEPKPDPAAELKNAIKDRLGDSNRDVHRVTVKAAAKAGKPINVKVAFDDNLDVQPGPHRGPEDVVAILKGGRRGRRLEVQGRRGPWHVFRWSTPTATRRRAKSCSPGTAVRR